MGLGWLVGAGLDLAWAGVRRPGSLVVAGVKGRKKWKERKRREKNKEKKIGEREEKEI